MSGEREEQFTVPCAGNLQSGSDGGEVGGGEDKDRHWDDGEEVERLRSQRGYRTRPRPSCWSPQEGSLTGIGAGVRGWNWLSSQYFPHSPRATMRPCLSPTTKAS